MPARRSRERVPTIGSVTLARQSKSGVSVFVIEPQFEKTCDPIGHHHHQPHVTDARWILRRFDKNAQNAVGENVAVLTAIGSKRLRT